MTYDEILAAIPPMTCNPGCGDCCGLVPWSPREWARVAARAPEGVILHDMDGALVPQTLTSVTCPFFDDGCTVYADRPFLCRLFGTAPANRLLACPHKCRPAVPLSRSRADWLTMLYAREERRR